MGIGRDWHPYGETVPAEQPCGQCNQSVEIHLGYSPTKGVRFAGIQVAGWANEDIAVCGRCGQAEHLGSEGRRLASEQGSWEITGMLGLGFINVDTGRIQRRPLR